MPVYVYRNQVTGETFEIQQRITEDALTTDPKTGDPVRRVIQPVGISFKGSGFYVNDSRGSSRSGGESGKTDAAKAESGSQASGGDKAAAPPASTGDSAKASKPAAGSGSASTD